MEWLDSFLGNLQHLGAVPGHQCVARAVDLFDPGLRPADGRPTPRSWASAPTRRRCSRCTRRTPFSVALLLGALLPAAVALRASAGRRCAFRESIWRWRRSPSVKSCASLILNSEDLTGGALGLNGIPQLTDWFDVALAVGLTLYVLLRLRVLAHRPGDGGDLPGRDRHRAHGTQRARL